MARKQYAGAAPQIHLSGQISAVDTTIVADTSSSAYPDGSVGNFVIFLGKDTATAEKVLCSLRVGATFTVATRGYDGTTASIHVSGETIDHGLDALSVTDLAGHVYDTTRDDHTQYAKTSGSRAITGTQTIANIILSGATVAGSATAGAATLPAAPAGFLTLSVNGTTIKLPYYNS